jgi:hypothetical protein
MDVINGHLQFVIAVFSGVVGGLRFVAADIVFCGINDGFVEIEKGFIGVSDTFRKFGHIRIKTHTNHTAVADGGFGDSFKKFHFISLLFS